MPGGNLSYALLGASHRGLPSLYLLVVIGHVANDAMLAQLEGKRLLLAASTGGHLMQLVRLAEALNVADNSEWLTFRTPQSESLLAGRAVHYVPYIRPRDYRRTFLASRTSLPLVRKLDGCLSTGAALAASCLPIAVALGKPAVYIESISRVLGPSLTGRLMGAVPGIVRYTQHASWAGPGWRVGPTILDRYELGDARSAVTRKVFVTLGTIRPYRFDRLVDFVLRVTGPDADITWQVGSTSRSDLPGRTFEHTSPERFDELVEESDVVVTHAGVGSLLKIMDSGKCPVVMARRAALGEHVDDHQAQILSLLSRAGLALPVTGQEGPEVLQQAASAVVMTRPTGR